MEVDTMGRAMGEMRRWLALALAGAAVLAAAPAAADDFYKGKTINIIVGFGPGGGYDIYARMLARHLGKHIPGNPSVVLQNMEGAGGVRAANHVYNVAPKDGTVIAGVNQGAAMFKLLGGKGAQYDPAKFQDRKSTRLNSSHANISYAVFCLKKKKKHHLQSLLMLHI